LYILIPYEPYLLKYDIRDAIFRASSIPPAYPCTSPSFSQTMTCDRTSVYLCCNGVHCSLGRYAPWPQCAPFVYVCVCVWVYVCVRQLACIMYLRVRVGVRESQCVAVCCSVLQCVAVCCRVLQSVLVCCNLLQSVAVCCNLLQSVAICCGLLQSVAVHAHALPHSILRWSSSDMYIYMYIHKCV